jgi:hypothetical protein
MHSNKIYEKEPFDMIVNNIKKYAYVVLLTKIDYFPGALVLAESLRNLGTEAELVIMVSSNIPESIRMILRGFYSKIIQIKRVPNINEKYNKLQALTLIDYNKVIVIDIDTIVLKYPDYLFTLETPAVFINGDNNGHIIYSGLYVLTPNNDMYNKIKDILINNEGEREGRDTNKEAVEGYKEYINYIFSKISKYKTIINNEYLGIKYSTDKNDLWKKSFMIQFVGDKPFFYKSKYSIEERIERDDNKLWFFYYGKIINKNFNLLNVKELEDVNNLSKYYLAELSRKIYTMTKILQSNVNTNLDGEFSSRLNKIFKTNEIKKNYVYYHIDSLKEYNSSYAPSYPNPTNAPSYPVLPNAPSYSALPNAPSYSALPNAPSYSALPNAPLYGRVDSINIIIGSNYKMIMLVNNDKQKIDEEIKDVSLKIEAKYDYKVKGYVIKNILVVLETELTYTERMDIINEEYKDNNDYYVSIVVYVYNDSLHFKNTTNIKIYEDINSKIKLTSLFFNKNTFDMIENKKLNFFKKYENILENLKFQSLKKWIYSNYLYNELQFLVIINNHHIGSSNNNHRYIIIDNNSYASDIIIKNKVELKLFFFDIIFTKSPLYKNKLNNVLNYDNNMIYCIDAINIVDNTYNRDYTISER